MKAALSLLLAAVGIGAAGEPAAAPGAAARESTPAPRSADPKAVEVVNAYLEAIGGRDALTAIQDRYEKFRVVRHEQMGGTRAIFERYLKRGGHVREDWHIDVAVADKPSLDVVQVYNAETREGWTKMWNFVSPLDARMIHMLVWDKFIDDFFMHWEQDGYALTYRGEGEVETRPCHVIDVYHATLKQRSRFFFDASSALLLKKQWTAANPEGPVRNERYYLEYREVKAVGGIEKPLKFSFKQEQLEEGDLVMEHEFLDLRINSNLSASIFARPEGEVFVAPDPAALRKKAEGDKPKEAEAPWMKKKRITPKAPGTEDAPPGGAPAEIEAPAGAEG